MSFQKLEFVKEIDQRVYSLLIEDYGEKSYNHFSLLINNVLEFLFEYYFDTIGEVYSESDILQYKNFLKSTRKDALSIKNDIFKVSSADCERLFKLVFLRGKVPDRNDVRESLLILHRVLINCYEYEKHTKVDVSYEDFFKEIGASDLIVEAIEKEKVISSTHIKPIATEPEKKTSTEESVADKREEIRNNNSTLKKQPAKKKSGMDFFGVVTLVQRISMLSFAAVGFFLWPFFIIAALILISIILHQGVLSYPPKREKISGIIILSVIGISWATLSGIHINKVAHAEENYNNLVYELEHFDGYFYNIDKYISELPKTYKDVSEIKSDREYLGRVINNYSSIERWNKVASYAKKHAHWNVSNYLWNYSMRDIIYNHYWSGLDNNYHFWYHWDSGEKLSSSIPNNKESSKGYYFFMEYGRSENHEFFINQTITFGYENINDKNDRFYAFRVENFGFEGSDAVVSAYCFKDGKTYEMKLND